MFKHIKIPVQNPLIITVDESEKILKNNSNAVWFDILNDFNYVDYVEIAVSYYDALYDYIHTLPLELFHINLRVESQNVFSLFSKALLVFH